MMVDSWRDLIFVEEIFPWGVDHNTAGVDTQEGFGMLNKKRTLENYPMTHERMCLLQYFLSLVYTKSRNDSLKVW
jgi:hypothetical protein